MESDLSHNPLLKDAGNLELFARQVVEGFITGLHKSPFHGFSVEFAEHRLYNNGDSIKNIDWKLLGRTDRMFVKRYEEETNLRCQIVLDTSASMYFPDPKHNKLVFSALSAAALIQLFRKQRDAFGLSLFSDELELSTPVKSTGIHQKYLFSELESLMNRPSRGAGTAVARSLHEIAEQIHKRSLVIIFSDMVEGAGKQGLEDIFAALQHLKHNKHEIVIFNVMEHQKELNLDFENRPYHFVDLENSEEVKIHPREVKESYLHAIAQHRMQLNLRCAQYRIDLVDADINQGFIPVLQSYLVKRSKMA